jgi:hypothetical protein
MNETEKDSLLELAHGYIERSLTPAQIVELEERLSRDEEARRIYLDYLHDHASLYWDQIPDNDQSAEITDFSDYRPSRFPSLWQAFAAAAVVALLSLVIMSRSEGNSAAFATMAKTESARWESGSLPTAEGARLGAGELVLVRGLATISFDSGAEVILEAPARLSIIDDMNCVLTHGTAVAEVSESAKGFVIQTPTAKVIDHGTRFAVNVNPASGATQTQVFEGLVEVASKDSRDSIELRTGQSSVTEGTELGKVSEGIEEATWTLPEVSPKQKDKSTVILTTGAPGGADANVKAGETTDHVSEVLVLLKNGLGEKAPHRKAYLRFTLETIPAGKIQSAALSLRFAPTGWGLASHIGDSEFAVYGLTDDAGDNWEYGTIDWNNAPANVLESGTQVQSTSVRKLGTFTLPRGIQAGTFGIQGEELVSFLNSDSNRKATIIVVRNTPEIRGGGLVHSFASSRHPSLPGPVLELRVGE